MSSRNGGPDVNRRGPLSDGVEIDETILGGRRSTEAALEKIQ
jgi:hypothetical protein